MSTIRCIYHAGEPSFPATDQHPDAVRYFIGQYVVDAIGGEPTPAEVDAVVNRPPIDLSDIDNLERTFKAQALLMRDYCNALKAEIRGLAVLLVGKGTITAAEANELLAYDGTGTGDQKTVADLKADFAAKYGSLP